MKCGIVKRRWISWLRGLVTDQQLLALRGECAAIEHSNRDRSHGIRELLSLSMLIRDLAWGDWRSELTARFDATLRPVRAILFDKVEARNWKVPYHQDRVIACRERHEVAGFCAWSTKGGVPHAEPPTEVLESMIALRVHVDDCSADNGPLRVLAGSHAHAKIEAEAIPQIRDSHREVVCEATAGDALLMRPLLLHASSPAAAASHRRVIHVEFAPADALPPPLEWAVEPPAD